MRQERPTSEVIAEGRGWQIVREGVLTIIRADTPQLAEIVRDAMSRIGEYLDEEVSRRDEQGRPTLPDKLDIWCITQAEASVEGRCGVFMVDDCPRPFAIDVSNRSYAENRLLVIELVRCYNVVHGAPEVLPPTLLDELTPATT